MQELVKAWFVVFFVLCFYVKVHMLLFHIYVFSFVILSWVVSPQFAHHFQLEFIVMKITIREKFRKIFSSGVPLSWVVCWSVNGIVMLCAGWGSGIWISF